MLGPKASFHDGQLESIIAVRRPDARVLVVQRTGWGKSLVYWIATRLSRDAGAGPTLIVSPLLSLMRNQIAMASKLQLRARTINSTNRDEWKAVEEALEANAVDVLLISPERLGNQDFMARILPALGAIGTFVIDEAHCISDWGHDFRPDYRRLNAILARLPASIPVLATTATANDRVVGDVADQLGTGVVVLRGTLARDSLDLHVVALGDQAERLAWLAENIPKLPGSGIIYCLTVADTVRVANWLAGRGLAVRPYNADMSNEDRIAAEEALLANEVKALVATSALGMGFDKPDLGFVVHYQRPGSAVAYYQQVGRAGRAVTHAEAILLTGREDDEIAEYFIESAFPSEANQRAVIETLESQAEMTLPKIERQVNIRRSEIQKVLQLAELDGAVGRDGGRFFRTPNPWAPDVERATRVSALRRAELAQIRAYTTYDGCLMGFLRAALDDPDAARCGHCANDGAEPVAKAVSEAVVLEATTYLRRDFRPLEPRKVWPAGAVPAFSGKIPPEERLEIGRALSMYGDAGWGRLVRDGKYTAGTFDLRLVEAAAELVARWAPDPYPTWVTAIPSASRPALVRDFALALSVRLGLPFVEVFEATGGASQKTMENSVQRFRNVHRKLALVVPRPEPGPVLLVDDIADSGWTFTYGGWLLRAARVDRVYPLALAVASNRADA
ncbi:MAG TPA: RecQ family ATP-dependent DNA helicase [Galbitalea sp.]|jgi:ATP-dependent DNA helicase RecQ